MNQKIIRSKIGMATLTSTLEKCWDAESSYLPKTWSSRNPARGQSAVSSLIVQDYLDGEIIRFQTEFTNEKEKHYANLVDDVLVDTTFKQFPIDTHFQLDQPVLGKFATIRKKLLSDSNTQKRYNYLKEKVSKVLNEAKQN